MSMKVFNGFQLHTSSAARLVDLVTAFRPWVEAQAQRKFEDFAASLGNKSVLDAWTLWLDMRDRTIDKGLRCPAVDTNFALVFFPDGDRFLGMACTENEVWAQEWLKQPGVSEYAYCDSQQRPDEISQGEWAARGEAWRRVLGQAAPELAGLKILVIDTAGPTPDLRPK